MKGRRNEQLPALSMNELAAQGFSRADFVLVSGDAYIDHPSFGAAIIARVLMDKGFSVGIIDQPDWHSPADFMRFGEPNLAFLVTGGNIDSMVNHYSASKHRRKTDAYTPGGASGKRPDRATIVYANRCREAYPKTPLIIGGIEASLRRFAHYDYWDDRVRHSILYDACADLLLYGMAERAIVDVAQLLSRGVPIGAITHVRGTCYRTGALAEAGEGMLLPSYAEVKADKLLYAKAFMIEASENDAVRGKKLIQPHEKGFLVANPPALPLTESEMDAVYALPFTRKPHPSYTLHIPAIDEVSFSITSARGCFGGCSFCALTFHQGRVIQPRSHASILNEAEKLTHDPDFRGYIHDVGGPTANFRIPACRKQKTCGVCVDRQCIGFEKCKNLTVSHEDYVSLLQKLRALPGVKKAFVRSGVRYDYVMYDRDDAFLKELCAHHISGQLKVAPEHVSDSVLYYMNKPPHSVFERFRQSYRSVNERLHTDQYLVPYLISSHPGSTLPDAIELAQYLQKNHMRPEQVQDFYPTPGTLSTCMYYTGLDPRTEKPVYVPRSMDEKNMQRALLQYTEPKNRALVRKALKKADREDLIGFGRDCLVPPERERDTAPVKKALGKPRSKKPVDKRRRSR